jgi:EmrB/QacA subfamily drug resistance transporter
MTTTMLAAPDKADTRRHLGLALLVIATAQLMVTLDATIVTVALPHIQTGLGFSGSGLEWVVNAYVLTLGGLLLLGGRAGDLFGRRRVFIAGLLLFSVASLAGGFATSQAWLLAARAVQGAGGAIVAPTALSLVATTFPEGPPRNRAMGVYAAMSVAGGVVGLIVGGLLVTYASWRWVLFVNVPAGIAAAFAALAVLPRVPSRPGRFDVLGAVTGTGGIAALVYGLSQADNGTSHWGDADVLVALAGGVVLLAAFAVIQVRSQHALLPTSLLRNRDRVGANLMMLGVGAAIGAVFFFLNLFVQDVWAYSALRAGLSFVPFTLVMLAATAAATRLVPRIGPRPLLMAGAVLCAGGLAWLSRLTAHSTYAGGLLGPALIVGAGLGLLFLPLSLVSLTGITDAASGAAASLLNTGRQVGAAVGLAVLGTVAWTVTADTARAGAAARPAAAAAARAAAAVRAAAWQAAAHQRALTAGFDRAFLVAAAIAVLMLVVAITVIGVRRADLADS